MDTVCKVRGITLNYNAKQLVNFEVIKGMILGTGGEPIVTVHTESKVKRKRKGGGTVSIVTEPEHKMYSISFFKRRRLDDNTSVLFEYKLGGCLGRGAVLQPDHSWVMILNLGSRFRALWVDIVVLARHNSAFASYKILTTSVMNGNFAAS